MPAALCGVSDASITIDSYKSRHLEQVLIYRSPKKLQSQSVKACVQQINREMNRIEVNKQ